MLYGRGCNVRTGGTSEWSSFQQTKTSGVWSFETRTIKGPCGKSVRIAVESSGDACEGGGTGKSGASIQGRSSQRSTNRGRRRPAPQPASAGPCPRQPACGAARQTNDI